MSNSICGFRDDYFFLSNFYNCEIEYNGLIFQNSESAFQSAKFTNLAHRMRFCNISGSYAKKLGRNRNIPIRDDWDRVRCDIMYNILLTKFTSCDDLKNKLIDTHDKHIEESNNWNDRFWGTCGGIGNNNLGKILMQIRNDLIDMN